MVESHGLIVGLSDSLGVTISARAMSDLQKSKEDFCFIPHDIEQITPQVKHMNILDMSDGEAPPLMSPFRSPPVIPLPLIHLTLFH
jgi:hypothetical protein